ncbi:sn-glycerol-3-phosphate ABC transporter substrate-binding protein [Williamsoniiplasma somnilux]|uniref:sn-glycerol-3-phosphate ABC transporter substrate-binding protein n=1 Tax=Williamsoniiplasma somnilux TaxID=215578 RepID=A0A2K8P0N3_9MOLU|nr:hypothetical protein [Williamsoniiplasma somnilux]ATZ18561.1 sn-glycerol-3-phosphate ABC transporter substrate-binding protein [Williamsoniiplasma somnilux]
MILKYKVKKALLPFFLGAVVVAGASATLAVSLKDRSNKNVVFEIDLNVAKSSGFIADAYRRAVNDFNAWNKTHGYTGIDVELDFAPANEVYNKLNSKAQLPNLYLTYADGAVRYEKLLPEKQKDLVVDIGNVINWNDEYEVTVATPGKPTKKEQVLMDSLKRWKKQSNKNNNEFIGKGNLDELMENYKDIPSAVPTPQPQQNKNKTMQTKEVQEDYNHYTPYLDSFIQEGLSNDGKMYVAPIGKSIMTGIINKKIVSEVYYIVTGNILDPTIFPMAEYFKVLNNEENADLANQDDFNKNYETAVSDPELQNKVRENQPKVDFSETVKDISAISSNNVYKKDGTKSIKDLVIEIFKDLKHEGSLTRKDTFKSAEESKLTKIFSDMNNVEIMTYVFWKITNNSSLSDQNKVNSYAMGADDITGLVYANIATGGEENLYNYNNDDPYSIQIQKESHGLQRTLDLFGMANKLAPFDGNGNGGNGSHPGTIFGGSGGYGSNYFVDGGMMNYYGSSAGASHWYWQKPKTQDKYKRLDITTKVHPEDLVTIGGITDGGSDKSSVVQQGPGIAMFKDKNVAKNKVAAKFLNFFLQPDAVSRFGIKASYIPSTKSAYEYNGQPGIFIEKGFNQNDKDYGTVYAKEAVEKYLDAIIQKKINLWTVTPSPFGDIMRAGVIADFFGKYYGTADISAKWDDSSVDFFWEAETGNIETKIADLFGSFAELKWMENK